MTQELADPESSEHRVNNDTSESSEVSVQRENSSKSTRESRRKRSREREDPIGKADADDLRRPQKMPPLQRHGLSNEEKKLTPANIDALQNLKRANASIEMMHRFTGWSDGVISKYTSHIEPMFNEGFQSEPPKNSQNIGEVVAPHPGFSPMQPQMTHLLTTPLLSNDGGNGVDVRPLQIQHPMTLNLDTESILLLYGQAGLYGFSDLPSFIKKKVLPSLRLTRLVEEAIPHDDDGLDLERSFLDTVGDAVAFRRSNKRAKDEAMKELEGKRIVSPT